MIIHVGKKPSSLTKHGWTETKMVHLGGGVWLTRLEKRDGISKEGDDNACTPMVEALEKRVEEAFLEERAKDTQGKDS